jgi:hypothetical protein
MVHLRTFQKKSGPFKNFPHESSSMVKKRKPLDVWAVGTELEAEMMDPEFPNYIDTIHPVRVVEVLPNGEYRCNLLAFGPEDCDVWPSALLHSPRPDGDINGAKAWKAGDQVHIRLRKRKAGKRYNVDGSYSDQGIWVKGVVEGPDEQEQGCFIVRHTLWGLIVSTTTAIVEECDIRCAY